MDVFYGLDPHHMVWLSTDTLSNQRMDVRMPVADINARDPDPRPLQAFEPHHLRDQVEVDDPSTMPPYAHVDADSPVVVQVLVVVALGTVCARRRLVIAVNLGSVELPLSHARGATLGGLPLLLLAHHNPESNGSRVPCG